MHHNQPTNRHAIQDTIKRLELFQHVDKNLVVQDVMQEALSQF